MRRIELAANERLEEKDIARESAALPHEIVRSAEAIVDDVRERGDAAVREYTERFDGICPDEFRVPSKALSSALDAVEPSFLASLKRAAEHIRSFHELQLEQDIEMKRSDGTRLGMRIRPLTSAGVYVPGGRANYPSTVLMDVIPAKVAGVKRCVMTTPPQQGGTINPYTLAAAAVAEVDEVYAIGGAQAIAALAYGTESIERVDKICGPGNAYVAAAKRYVLSDVGIDMIAGPSEVCVYADASAHPAIVAADLLAQAEHDPLAACYLVTCDVCIADQVEQALDLIVSQSPRQDICVASLERQGRIIVCYDETSAVDAINLIAPEHLELHCEDAEELLERIEHAGAIFVGEWSSEPLGDYFAGPNHTLPTGGTARFSNPLGVYDFQHRSSVIRYTQEGLMNDAIDVQVLAQAEGLWAHALSVGMRHAYAQGELPQTLDTACEDVSQLIYDVKKASCV